MDSWAAALPFTGPAFLFTGTSTVRKRYFVSVELRRISSYDTYSVYVLFISELKAVLSPADTARLVGSSAEDEGDVCVSSRLNQRVNREPAFSTTLFYTERKRAKMNIL